MRSRLLTSVAIGLAAAIGLGGCAYKSSYRQTNFKHKSSPVAAKKVRVVKSRDNLKSEWVELGNYHGRAPTLQEAMDTAKSYCGNEGGNLFVLHAEPHEGSGWNVDGVCGSTRTSKSSKKDGRPVR